MTEISLIGLYQNKQLWQQRYNEIVLTRAIRVCPKYIHWRNAVLDRDDFKCQSCQNPAKISTTIIEPFNQIITQNNIKTFEAA